MDISFFSSIPTDVLRYSIIVLFFLISVVISLRSSNRRDAVHQVFCLFFAIVADYIILFTDAYQIGVIVFWCAHITAIRRYQPKLFVYAMAAAITGWIICIIMTITGTTVPVVLVSSFYAAFILTATVSSYFARQKRWNNLCSRLGMTLFVMCDINVIFYNMLPQNAPSIPVFGTLIWVFYVPAQFLLSISAYSYLDKKSQ